MAIWTSWPKGDPQANWQIFRLDREHLAIRAELCRRELVNQYSAASWQRAWDKHPDLKARDTANLRERGQYTDRRDRIAEREAAQAERRERAAARKAAKLNASKPCPTCGHVSFAH